MDPILEQFLGEARENLYFLDQNLAKLADDDPEMMNALFRAAHTLKGGAGLVGLDSIKTITHYAEDLLDGIKKGKVVFTESMLDTLYEAFDEIIEMVDATESNGGIPEFDKERVDEIAHSVKLLMGEDYHNRTKDKKSKLDTELQIKTTSDEKVGNLISSHNIGQYIGDLNFDFVEITPEYIEENNYYLIDFDLDEDSCDIGNDPVYLIYLLGDEDVCSIATTLYDSCENIRQNPKLWKTRLTVVVKTNKEIMEESLANVIDFTAIYPLTVKSLLLSSYESQQGDLFEEFAQDFLEILNSGNYGELSERLSAVTKILNPESKEGFMLSRLEMLLPNFEFESIDYLELVKFVSYSLGLSESSEDSDAEDEEKVDPVSLSDEQLTVIGGLKQQLKVLKYAKDDTALSRVRLHSKNSLEFIDVEPNFHVSDDKAALAEKICYYILELNPSEDLSEFTKLTTEDVQEVIKEENENREELLDEIEVIEEDISKTVDVVQDTKIDKVKEPKMEVKEEVVKEDIQKEIKPTPKPEAIKNTVSAVPKTVKIDQVDIDDMMDIMGELLVMKNSLPYLTNSIGVDTTAVSKTNFNAKYEEINRVTEQLQDIVMGMRLLPLSYIFSRYPKLIRDTSKELGKRIKFEEFGGETKLDKMMIEKIADPLVHIIRNSLDHGIEVSPEDRAEVGKDPMGIIEVGAKSVGDKVFITVKDDGRGINTTKVLMKALEMELITEDDIETMSEQEKLMLIFNPGLSTAETVTDISGRGVGTDAVKRVIEELSGKISLESKEGVGATVTIELPVSVALTNVFCVKMDGNNYAIAMENITETIKINSKDIKVANNRPFANLRGDIIPLVFEPRLLPSNQRDERVQFVVIVQTADLRYGLVVNEFINQLNVIQKPLAGVMHNHPMITGTSLLGNGEILFILDVNKIVE